MIVRSRDSPRDSSPSILSSDSSAYQNDIRIWRALKALQGLSRTYQVLVGHRSIAILGPDFQEEYSCLCRIRYLLPFLRKPSV